jgi:hypothetical protein
MASHPVRGCYGFCNVEILDSSDTIELVHPFTILNDIGGVCEANDDLACRAIPSSSEFVVTTLWSPASLQTAEFYRVLSAFKSPQRNF